MALTAALALLSAPASADTLVSGTAPLDLHLWRIGAALILCTLLAIAAALLMRRFGAPKSFDLLKSRPRAIAVLETQAISPHASACRLGFDGREYLVIVSSGAATIVASRDATGGER